MDDSDPHHFTFDLDAGIRAQLVEHLETTPKLALEKGVGPLESGLYAIFLDGDLVYIGKATKTFTKSGRTLRARLGEHVGKLSARTGGDLSRFQVTYATFDSDWWVVAGEVALIRHLSPPWNDSGFGSKTPGVGRPGTNRVSDFDRLFPPPSDDD
ncbi:MAG: Eco29kI family restriction endonuclease [Sphingopyxis sp.]|uniref:Eco29kI family restriction endonuclease n=1 Tax=Sphingopyxis sp. TaxID=1908224 RepID=UPI002ABA4E57|nr:Eco29kI family restriction endonuclease [Sphingopyxis sp.]MDZ3830759.1 Eco29kI family restriction endonuclease [Sphingopyxis sp.]